MYWVPPLQVLVQEDQELHLEVTQSTGHFWVLHTRDLWAGQPLPPLEAFVETTFTRVWTPVPQVLEQAVHGFHWKTQSTGQGWTLQFLRETLLGQARPPLKGWLTTERVFHWMPPPHFSVHLE